MYLTSLLNNSDLSEGSRQAISNIPEYQKEVVTRLETLQGASKSFTDAELRGWANVWMCSNAALHSEVRSDARSNNLNEANESNGRLTEPLKIPVRIIDMTVGDSAALVTYARDPEVFSALEKEYTTELENSKKAGATATAGDLQQRIEFLHKLSARMGSLEYDLS